MDISEDCSTFSIPMPEVHSLNTATVDFAQKYECEWNNLAHRLHLKDLQQIAISGHLRASCFRSICWRILLGILPPCSPSCWFECVTNTRLEYSAITRRFTIDPHQMPTTTYDNPLSQDTNSIWYRYLCDVELKKIIAQDVDRTYPENSFFQTPQVKNMMINILFYYARQFPDISYKQGMNEILAPILYVLNMDYEAFERATRAYNILEPYIREVLNSHCMEHDAYCLFKFIMDRVKKFYQVKQEEISMNLDNVSDNNAQMDVIEDSYIGDELASIEENILAKWDPALYSHLKQLDISFTVFGIRWLRLLYGREFPFDSLFVLWDAIFAYNADCTLVNYVLVAMLVFIRDKLLKSDYTECLNLLMKYPESVDVKSIVRQALYFKDPHKFQKPGFTENGVKSHGPCISGYSEFPGSVQSFGYSSQSKVSGKEISSLAKRLKNLSPYSHGKRNRRDFESSGSNTLKLPFTFQPPSSPSTEEDAELRHMKVVMSLCKLKLEQYHNILIQSISTEDIKAQQALTGIQELCALLDVDHFHSTKHSNDNIETASEARDIPAPPCSSPVPPMTPTNEAVVLCLPPPRTDVNMTVFKCTENEPVKME